jgi:hypothetical protein
MDQPAINQALKECYEFDDADLEANRNGRLTERQTKMLADRSKMLKFGGVGLGTVLIVLALLLPACIVPVSLLAVLVSRDWAHALEGAAGSLVWLLVFGVPGVYFLRSGSSQGRSQEVLRNIQGPIAIHTVTLHSSGSISHEYEQYQMKIGNDEFVLDDELVGKVTEGGTYAINFIDFQNGSEGLILSMECLSPGVGS